MVLLKNEGLLPLQKGVKIYSKGIKDLSNIEQFGEVVDDPADADVIVLRITTPYGDPKSKSMIEKFFRQGRLYYSDEELEEIFCLTEEKPTVVIIYLERPAILTETSESCTALMADFGTSVV